MKQNSGTNRLENNWQGRMRRQRGCKGSRTQQVLLSWRRDSVCVRVNIMKDPDGLFHPTV